MRAVFLILILIHAIIHLFGFLKAFRLAEFKQLSSPISTAIGMVWLLAFLLFVVLAIFFFMSNEFWWAIGLMAVITSQVLIVAVWKDAKYGTIVNILVLAVSIIGYMQWSFILQYRKDVSAHILNNETEVLLTEADLAALPLPVARYIRYAGCLNKPKVENFKVLFEGKIRKDENSEWMNFSSEQYNFMSDPTRLFFMKAVMKGLPVAGYHGYHHQQAFMDIKLLSLFPVQYQDGPVMSKAETVTFFNDMCCMAPATLIDKRIKWLTTEPHSVTATFTNDTITITAQLIFNEEGQLINFISPDRTEVNSGKTIPWSTPLKNYRNIGGNMIAGSADVVYHYPDHELCYGTFVTKYIAYNVKQ